jgi:hypothetical protein
VSDGMEAPVVVEDREITTCGKIAR